jgi:hypothetical protein
MGEVAVHDTNATVPYDENGLICDVTAVDVRTDGFHILVVGSSEWPLGFRLGLLPRDAVSSASGDITEDEGGLIVWFPELPGEVNYADGSRIVYRETEDAYVLDVTN